MAARSRVTQVVAAALFVLAAALGGTALLQSRSSGEEETHPAGRRSAATQSPSRVAAAPTTSGAAPPPPVVEPFRSDAEMQAGVVAADQYAAGLPAGTDVGVAVADRATGQLAMGTDGQEPFYSASVVKLFLITQILREKEAGQVQVTASDTALMQLALRSSDDAAMDALWESFDGPGALADLIEDLQLTGTTVPTDTAQWGETLITARDVITVYDYVLDSLSESDRDFVVDSLGAATDDGTDGFDQAFGLLAPPRMPTVKAKQGWMSYGPDYYLHTTGLLGSDNRFVVVVLTEQSAAAGWDSARAVDDKLLTTLLNG